MIENTSGLKRGSFYQRLRARAYGITIFVALIAITAAITLVAITSGGVAEPTAPVAASTMVFDVPVSGEYVVIKNYSNTELKYNNTLKQWEAHKAIDFKVDEGTAVLAAYDGKVVKVEDNLLMGTTIEVEHKDGINTVYCSLAKEVNVAVGDVVKKGQQLGKVANTSTTEQSDGPHLHFEVRQNNAAIDPTKYLNLSEK